MPNHCNNEVTLQCPSEEVAIRLQELLAGEESLFDFNCLCPEPKELLDKTDDPDTKAERIARYGHDDWYDWRLAHWGNKWNSYDCSLDDSDIRSGRLLYCFLTAWGPPDGICSKLMAHLDDEAPDTKVSWFYYEPMNGIRGQLEKEA